MKLWEKLTSEQLIKILKEENTYEDVQVKLGYTYRSSRNSEIDTIALNLNVDISNYTNRAGTNLQGQTFQHLQVLHIDKENSNKGKGTFWICKCLDCNKEISVRKDRLKTQINCGCTKSLSLEGQTFTYITVLSKAGKDKNRNILYNCRCKCGKEFIAAGSRIKNGLVKSCGCYWNSKECRKQRIVDLQNQTFGFLKVLEYDETKSQEKPYSYWKCQCLKCNTIISVRNSNLRKGQISCGCIRSKGESKIIDILKEHNIRYQKEVAFSGLSDKKKLRYDFGIYDAKNNLLALIEYNGIQHYQAISFFGGEESLQKQKEHDKQKQEYCKNNNIPLIIFNNINDIKIDKIYEVIQK